MSRYLSGSAPVVIASLSIFISAICVWSASSVYVRDIQKVYTGGLRVDYLGLALWLGIAVLFAVLAILHALALALIRWRWIWAGALVAAVALGYVGLAESASDAAHTAISLVFGGGVSGAWPFVAQFAVILLGSLFALVSVLVEARRSRGMLRTSSSDS